MKRRLQQVLGHRRLPWALGLLAIALTLGLFFRVSKWAGLLLVPYLAWVTFAAALNFSIWRLNP